MKIEMIENRKPIPTKFNFGDHFADYMLEMDYVNGKWQEVVIKPYGIIEIEPSMSSLHYGQTVFEGLKGYRRKDGGINMFRPMDNFARLNKSHKRMCMPLLTNDDIDRVFDGLLNLLRFNDKWVPNEPSSLYIRMHTFASENFIGIRPSDKYKLFIICSPVPPYLNGFAPTKLMVPENYIRASKGGTGEAKSAGNYDGTLVPVQEAHKRGYDNCLFLSEGKHISECSAANIFFVMDGTIVTPKLDGTILHGITRDSIIKLAQLHEFDVREEHITIDHLFAEFNAYMLDEIFMTGTAAVVIPVSEIYYKDYIIKPNYEIGRITKFMYDKLTGIQYSRVDDTFDWITKVI